jgi:hypothetical protein
MRSWRGRAHTWAGVVLICLGLVAGRVVISSYLELRETDRLEGEARIFALGRAARLYAPGNPFSRRALDALRAIGEAGGPDALAAWQEIRSALLATRSFYTPHPARLAEADAHIAEAMAAAEPERRGSLEARRAWHAARLAERHAPLLGWTLLALLGLAVWLAGAVLFIRRAVGADERLRPRPALGWAAVVAFGLILFYIGLWRA